MMLCVGIASKQRFVYCLVIRISIATRIGSVICLIDLGTSVNVISFKVFLCFFSFGELGL